MGRFFYNMQETANIYPTMTDVFHWLYDDRHKAQIIIEQGGTSSSKTYSIMQLLWLIAVTEQSKVITVIGQDLPNLKRGAMRDFENIIGTSELLQKYIKRHNKNENIYQFITGCKLEFVAYQTAQDAKSGKRDYLFVNEANGVSYDIYVELADRTTENIFLDYNATAAFWVHDKLIGKPNVIRHISNYKNNAYISANVRQAIESYKETDIYRWKVYGLGLTGVLKSDMWLHSFNESRHVGNVQYNPKEPVYISIDFNVGKFVAIAFQCSDVDNQPASWFHVLREFVLNETSGSISVMAHHIREAYPTSLLFVTGDQSGSRRDVGYSKSNDTLLTLLQRALNIGNRQMLFGAYNKNLPTSNPTFQNSWAHCNNTLSLHKNFKISNTCKELINDCRIAVFDTRKGGFTLKKGDGAGVYAMNALDCLRYAIAIKCKSFAKVGSYEI